MTNGMKVSLDGLIERQINRPKTDKGQKFMLEEFLKHFAQAKEAFQKNEMDLVKQFFELYVVR